MESIFPDAAPRQRAGALPKRRRRRKSASPGREAPPRAGRFISGIREKPHEKRKNLGKAEMNLRIREELDDPIDCYLGLSPYTFKILSKSIISVTIRAFVSILKADHRPSEGVCFSFSHNN